MNQHRPLSIGLVFETFDTYPRRDGEPPDQHAEYEPPATLEALARGITVLGHRAVRLGSPFELLERIAGGGSSTVDVVLNIAEGFGTRNREAWAPSLLEMAGIPYLGSDGLTLSLTLDKLWANRMAAAAGIPVAEQCTFEHAAEVARARLPAPFPLFVKPRWEGTSKGICASSRVEDVAALAQEVDRVVRGYGQPALVERFLEGAEYTVSVVGNDPPRALPVLQRALEVRTRIGLHALEGGTSSSPEDGGEAAEHCLPGDLSREIEAELKALALRSYRLFECRDFARVDFRLDAEGAPVFLEINPLPTFAPDGTFAILAELEGRPYEELLAEVLHAGLQRLRLLD